MKKKFQYSDCVGSRMEAGIPRMISSRRFNTVTVSVQVVVKMQNILKHLRFNTVTVSVQEARYSRSLAIGLSFNTVTVSVQDGVHVVLDANHSLFQYSDCVGSRLIEGHRRREHFPVSIQ